MNSLVDTSPQNTAERDEQDQNKDLKQADEESKDTQQSTALTVSNQERKDDDKSDLKEEEKKISVSAEVKKISNAGISGDGKEQIKVNDEVVTFEIKNRGGVYSGQVLRHGFGKESDN